MNIAYTDMLAYKKIVKSRIESRTYSWNPEARTGARKNEQHS